MKLVKTGSPAVGLVKGCVRGGASHGHLNLGTIFPELSFMNLLLKVHHSNNLGCNITDPESLHD